MEKGGSKNPNEQLWESHSSVSVDASWLAANIEEVNQSYNQIREILETAADIYSDKLDAYYEKQSRLIAHVDNILQKHQFLAEQFEKLQSCNDNPSVFHQQNGGDTIIGFSNESCFQTPDTKSNSHYVNAEALSADSSQMSGRGSSGTSVKEGSEYSALSSDSDSETSKPSAYKSAKSHVYAHRMLEHHFVDKEEVGGRGQELLGRMAKYEEELSDSRKNLHLSEREVSGLKKELDDLTGTFESQPDSAQMELRMQDISLEMEKNKVAVLQNQVSVLESQIVNSNTKIESLEMELDLAKLNLENAKEEIKILKSRPSNNKLDDSTELKNQLELAQQQVAILDAELDGEKRKASERQDMIQQYISDISNRDDCIGKLKTFLQEVTAKSHDDEVELQSHIYSLTDHITFLEANNDEWGNRCELLEEQIQQCEAAMTEMRRLHEVQESRWKADIDLLKTELNEKVGLVENLNKGLVTLKLKYDVLEAEKASADGKVDALEAELGSKENDILQMKGLLHQLHLEKVETISASESALKQYEDVKLKLKNLEKEVERQKVLILNIAEEKREAIRQLCHTMEYYRNCYEELLQACKRLKRHCIVAS